MEPIAYEMQHGVLRAHVLHGERTLEGSIDYWRAIGAEVRRRGARMVLVVVDLPGEPPDIGDAGRFVQALLGFGFEGVRVAHVDVRKPRPATAEAAEIEARAQGFDARVFNDEAEALRWLRYG